MAFNPEHLITRHPIIDRNLEISFCLLSVEKTNYDVMLPFMLRLTNIERPEMVYFLSLEWVEDAVVLKNLPQNMVLYTHQSLLGQESSGQAKVSRLRMATSMTSGDARQSGCDFTLTPLGSDVKISPDTVLTHVATQADFDQAEASGAMYFSGSFYLDCLPTAGVKANIHPAHAVVLQLMAAVQKEAEPKELEILINRDVTLSFKLLRYVNSPFYGLARRIESVRHAVSIVGYQQLFKWLALLAVTAGSGASPALTHTAMTRAKLMELLGGKRVDRKEQDNLFIAGMFSLLDRIMGMPLEQVLGHVNLPQAIAETLLAGEGKYRRYLDLALACEGGALAEAENYADFDVKAVNIAHLEAIEWATQISRIDKA